MKRLKPYLKLMRVSHYVKNLLVFVALACSGRLFVVEKFVSCLAAFVAFCMLSSVVYIVNDIRDREKDRLHPVKCKRPIAAGTVSIAGAWALAAGLLAVAVVCLLLTFHPASLWLPALYLALNLAYSFGLKDLPILDVAILAAGFFLRVYYGALVTEIAISRWLYLTVFVLAFYFALGKRRNELKRHGGETRRVLKAYTERFLDQHMGMCLTLANVFYALWSMDERTMAHYENRSLFFTVPIVLLITMKYGLDIEKDSEGDPVDVLLHDKALLALCVLYLASMFAILYL